GEILLLQTLLVFKQPHSEEIGDFACRTKPILLIEADCALQRFGSVQGDAPAIATAKLGLCSVQKLLCNAVSVPRRTHCHAAYMSLLGSDDAACYRADNLGVTVDGYEDCHLRHAFPDRL